MKVMNKQESYTGERKRSGAERERLIVKGHFISLTKVKYLIKVKNKRPNQKHKQGK